MDGARGDSFLALVHHNGKIKKRISEGVRFKCDCPTNVFISGGTSLADLQATIERRLGLDARKRVSHIFYRVLVAVQFPEVRTTELYVEIADVGACSGGSNLHPQPVHIGPTHCPPDVGGNDDGCDFDDNRSFGELVVAIAASPQPPYPRMGHVEPEPLVEEALRCDGSEEEPVMIEGDSDDDPADGGSGAYVHGSIGSSVGGEFQIGQTFQSKEEVLLAPSEERQPSKVDPCGCLVTKNLCAQ
ncbi:hypothetical protein PIB30_052757 [Stylosanthes scabra]|uniref:Ubiquitinyl hydrolase 1 n=1 Tax=Stylosanthes scabra TaxID=79078 RepID=A0ABU6YJG7_9FABA|nr:hypothetical protein [Stylosanthes scabra]